MLPVVHERLIARMIQYEPLLGMATLGLALDVPVVPMHSLLQFFDGKRVESQVNTLVFACMGSCKTH
jgi:hypothetical protein